MRDGMVVSPVKVVIVCFFLILGYRLEQLSEQPRNGFGSFPCLISWRFFRGNYVVLWLNSLGWRRLTCYINLLKFLSILYCRVMFNIF